MLAIGWRRYEADLLDISAGGFAILTRVHVAARWGETVRLKTAEGWTNVRVAYCWQQMSGSQLGLIRGPELIVSSLAGPPSASPFRRIGSPSGLPWLLGAALAGGVLVAIVTAERWAHWLLPESNSSAVHWIHRPAIDVRPQIRVPEPSTVEATMHARLLLAPAVREYLALSDHQVLKIDTIARTAEVEVRGLPRKATAMILASAYRQACRQLTAAQQQKWQAYRQQPDEARSPQ